MSNEVEGKKPHGNKGMKRSAESRAKMSATKLAKSIHRESKKD